MVPYCAVCISNSTSEVPQEIMEGKRIVHYIVKILLFLTFCYVFGFPSLKLFTRKDLVVKESLSVAEYLPAISVCLVIEIGINNMNINIIFMKFFSLKIMHLSGWPIQIWFC